MRVGIPDGLDEEAITYLQGNGLEVITKKDCEAMGIEGLLRGADAIAARSATKIIQLPDTTQVKIFGRVGSGVDNFSKAWQQIEDAGIPIVNSPEPNSHSVPELVLSYLLHYARDVGHLFEETRQGGWDKRTGKLLYGTTIGVVGGGLIGANVAQTANSLGMRVLVHDTRPELSRARGEFVKLDTLLRESDFVTLHVPATDRPLIGERELGLMKKTAVLINTARGGVVDEAALLRALTAGTIARAYSDVYTTEPFDGSDAKKKPSAELTKLLRDHRLFGTSHIGASTEEGQREASLIIARKFVNYLLYGYLSDACNMQIDTGLNGLRGLFHRAGMFTRQYADGAVRDVRILLDGEQLLTSGDEVRKQLEASYLCGLLSGNGAYYNPLNISKAGLTSRITNVDQKKTNRVVFEVTTTEGAYAIEMQYDGGRLSGIRFGNDGMYETDLSMIGHLALLEHANVNGALAVITRALALKDIGIVTLANHPRDGTALTAVQTYQPISRAILDDLVRNSPHQLAEGKPGIAIMRAKYLEMPPANAF